MHYLLIKPPLSSFSMMDINKNRIRRTISKQRNHLSPLQQQQAAAQITDAILNWQVFQAAKEIALYFPWRGEVNTEELWQLSHALGKNCYFPVVQEEPHKHLLFLPHKPDQSLVSNRFSILEPTASLSEAIDSEKLELVFTPLLAFDCRGYRLGSGEGYYDRTFAFLTAPEQIKPLLIGLAYEFQKVDNMPIAHWDVPLNAIVTEKTTYWRQA